ncbi:MAG: hypothetical protein Tsb002_27150 [Wenzhouxiangellaceae bacterium]
MKQRKHFKSRINELEEIYKHHNGDQAILEELEEELQHRSTQRAKKLLNAVQKSLKNDKQVKPLRGGENRATTKSLSPSLSDVETIPDTAIQHRQITSETDPGGKIDWDHALRDFSIENQEPGEVKAKALSNRPTDILELWTVLEALSPQTYKKPSDLVIGQGSVAYLKEGQEPWLRGEKSRPKSNLYYIMYLGSVDVEKATEKLLRLYQDKRIERPSVRGFAALGVILLDKRGIPIPETSLSLSSFGWSYARALQGNLQELKSWEQAEKILADGLEEYIYHEDENGESLPFTYAQAKRVFQWIIHNCDIPIEDTVEPSFAIRLYQPFSRGEPEAPLLNSFYLDDLQRAKRAVQKNSAGVAISQYLRISKPEHYFDILKEKQHIECALQPKHTPLARWPSNGRHSLVLLQQNAVHLAKAQLEGGGLFSVNGPPGTGKTTLLRDIVASVLVDRAKALCAFKHVDDAFKHAGKIRLGKAFVHLYKLDESLRGHEILVASTNNKAVENISKELPLRAQIAQDIGDLEYFKTISQSLEHSGEETWGLCAAVLGNAKNRSEFINKVWWESGSSLRDYFLSITGQLDFDVDDHDEEIIPRIIQECDPPKSLEEARHRWRNARRQFHNKVEKAQAAVDQAQTVYEATVTVSELKLEIERLLSEQAVAKKEIIKAEEKQVLLEVDLKEKAEHLRQLQLQNQKLIREKPRFFKRLFARSEWRVWRENYNQLQVKLTASGRLFQTSKNKLDESVDTLSGLHRTISEIQGQIESLQSKRDALKAQIKKLSSVCEGKLVTSDLWAQDHAQQQVFTPNFTAEAQRLRDDVFVAAIHLHKAFIDTASKQLRQNLGAFFSYLNGKNLPEDKVALLPHLWSSAFLLTPVMSTTFASVGRMLNAMPKESFGWLLIDEAGQATPQAAVGAIHRAKRVVCVGDPLQIEPVVTLSNSLVEGISKHFSVDPHDWVAPDASIQTVSDRANCYGTTIPRGLSEIRIGSPLLVHRRCEDPMFTISNRLAYSGLMVQATEPKQSDVTELFGKQSKWFDIRGSAQDKWCPEEGEFVADMLLKRFEQSKGNPEIFVISPFRIVAERMSQRMRLEEDKLLQYGIENPSDWIYNNIGTVHTFQGKETKAVILLLGAPSAQQGGARNWATSNVNLLNVAVSRAKHNFYVVGNKSLWGDLGNMKLVSKYISD